MSKTIASRLRVVVGRAPSLLAQKIIKKYSSVATSFKTFSQKIYLAYLLPFRHERLRKNLEGSSPIRVAFVASNLASWKVDQVVEAMNASENFHTTVFLARFTNRFNGAIADHEYKKLSLHFEKKGFNYVDTFSLTDVEIRQAIRRFNPHAIFITNPYSLISPTLHQELLSERLTCYVPYHHEVVAYGDNREQYDQLSHNAFWKVFTPHHTSKEYYKNTRMKGGRGVVVTGLPACEPLFEPSPQFSYPWKSQFGEKLRVIWAPHWLIRSDLKLATIYELGAAIKELAWRYQDRVEWVMRPHPFLRPTLVNHPDWGKRKTDDFFQFWAESDFTQIEEGEYTDLFHTSDAMIHDSGSFLAEYLCVDKPVMYLKTERTSDNYLNDFGMSALNACAMGRGADDIERFIESLLNGEDPEAQKRRAFIDENLAPLYSIAPSQKICFDLLTEFGISC